METTITTNSSHAATGSNSILHSVFTLMKLTYGIVPIVAGLDKFTNILVPWDTYLNAGIASMIPFSAHTFMMIVGAIEILAGVLVLIRPAIGGFVVMAWLTLIALTLIFSGNHYDVAVRDLVMAIGAFSMARLARITA
jgi:hypothetical protein